MSTYTLTERVQYYILASIVVAGTLNFLVSIVMNLMSGCGC